MGYIWVIVIEQIISFGVSLLKSFLQQRADVLEEFRGRDRRGLRLDEGHYQYYVAGALAPPWGRVEQSPGVVFLRGTPVGDPLLRSRERQSLGEGVVVGVVRMPLHSELPFDGGVPMVFDGVVSLRNHQI